jgi:hypothetical protein
MSSQVAEGDFVKVAGAQNQAEAEFVQALLREEGVPSMLRRSAGFDVPDFLAAGPRDVLVPASSLGIARDVLVQADLEPLLPVAGPVAAPRRVLLVLLATLALVAIIVWCLTEWVV